MPDSMEFRIPRDSEILGSPADIAESPAGPSTTPVREDRPVLNPAWQRVVDQAVASSAELRAQQQALLQNLRLPPPPPQPSIVSGFRDHLDSIRALLADFEVHTRAGLQAPSAVAEVSEEIDNAVSSLTGYQRNLANWLSVRSGVIPTITTNLFQDLAILQLLSRGFRTRERQLLLNLVAFLSALREWAPDGWDFLTILTNPLRIVTRRRRRRIDPVTGRRLDPIVIETPVTIEVGQGQEAPAPVANDPIYDYDYCDFRGLD
eukprot:jgi/Mesvir1/24343/Mv25248-RA.1